MSEVKKAEDRLNTLVQVLGAQRNEAHNVVANLKTDLLLKEKECKDLTVRLEELKSQADAAQAKLLENIGNLMARIEALNLENEKLREKPQRKKPQT